MGPECWWCWMTASLALESVRGSVVVARRSESVFRILLACATQTLPQSAASHLSPAKSPPQQGPYTLSPRASTPDRYITSAVRLSTASLPLHSNKDGPTPLSPQRPRIDIEVMSSKSRGGRMASSLRALQLLWSCRGRSVLRWQNFLLLIMRLPHHVEGFRTMTRGRALTCVESEVPNYNATKPQRQGGGARHCWSH